MKTIGNIVWFVLCGVWLGIAYLLAGLLSCVTIIGIPFGIASFKLAGLALFPLGKAIVPLDYVPAAGEQVVVSVSRPGGQ